MKFVKIGKKIKTLPRNFFVYNSLLVSLKNLTSRKDFLSQCEQWRQSTKACDGWLTDVYDGRLRREWFNKAGRPFLEVPGNLLLMMNVDWFRPFKHSIVLG